MENKKISVIIPTYNEADCIVPLINEILKIHLPLNIIVVDDNSPDKTGKIVEEKFKNNPYVHVFIRKGKRGRGLAGIFGYKKAIEIGSDIIGEMDGDFSHHPSYIPEMVKNINGYDVVVGSRYISGGKEERKSLLRKLITKFAHLYIKTLLGIDLHDPTSGFRFFKREVIESILPFLSAEDPFIVTEVYFYIKKKKFKIKEIPITFYERRKGKSKLNMRILVKYLVKVLKLKLLS